MLSCGLSLSPNVTGLELVSRAFFCVARRCPGVLQLALELCFCFGPFGGLGRGLLGRWPASSLGQAAKEAQHEQAGGRLAGPHAAHNESQEVQCSKKYSQDSALPSGAAFPALRRLRFKKLALTRQSGLKRARYHSLPNALPLSNRHGHDHEHHRAHAR